MSPRPSQSKTVSLPHLVSLSARMHAEGERLVLTNGCFDLLHVGHVRYLEEARALGDALAVGLNSDDSVRRIKGEGRPVYPAADRAEVLGALESVDYICVFDDETAERLVASVKPAVYVKGGDYSADPRDPRFPPEGEIVLGYGGSVHVIDYVAGRSTSGLIERLSGRSG